MKVLVVHWGKQLNACIQQRISFDAILIDSMDVEAACALNHIDRKIQIRPFELLPLDEIPKLTLNLNAVVQKTSSLIEQSGYFKVPYTRNLTYHLQRIIHPILVNYLLLERIKEKYSDSDIEFICPKQDNAYLDPADGTWFFNRGLIELLILNGYPVQSHQFTPAQDVNVVQKTTLKQLSKNRLSYFLFKIDQTRPSSKKQTLLFYNDGHETHHYKSILKRDFNFLYFQNNEILQKNKFGVKIIKDFKKNISLPQPNLFNLVFKDPFQEILHAYPACVSKTINHALKHFIVTLQQQEQMNPEISYFLKNSNTSLLIGGIEANKVAELGLCHQAKKSNIPVIATQHGGVYGGYRGHRLFDGKLKDKLNYFFSWGKIAQQTKEITPIGSLHLSKLKTNPPNDSILYVTHVLFRFARSIYCHNPPFDSFFSEVHQAAFPLLNKATHMKIGLKVHATIAPDTTYAYYLKKNFPHIQIHHHQEIIRKNLVKLLDQYGVIFLEYCSTGIFESLKKGANVFVCMASEVTHWDAEYIETLNQSCYVCLTREAFISTIKRYLENPKQFPRKNNDIFLKKYGTCFDLSALEYKIKSKINDIVDRPRAS